MLSQPESMQNEAEMNKRLCQAPDSWTSLCSGTQNISYKHETALHYIDIS